MPDRTYDIAIIGGGIIGVATAEALAAGGALDPTTRLDASIVLLEAEDHLAAHQTGNNSGVIHSGLYYRPGSLKARNCATGRDALYRFCEVQGLPHERCGKVVVARRAGELAALEELERRGLANGLTGLRRLSADEIHAHEPAAAGIAGLLVPDTGIVDYVAVTERLAGLARERGVAIRLGTRLAGVVRDGDALRLLTPRAEFRCRLLVNCAGLQSDRVARLASVDPGVRIIPFRGEYYALTPERRGLVRNLIYPVPAPALPFLGVHFTRRINGTVEAGPNAVFAFKREGYVRLAISAADLWDAVTFVGFWRMAAHYWQVGIGESWRSLYKPGFVRALQHLVPELRGRDLFPSGAGVRAQAVSPSGRLLDDFHIVDADRMIHVLNAPSPAATACLSIARQIALRVREHLAR